MKRIQSLLSKELVVSIVIILLLILIVSLGTAQMPDMANMMVVAGLLVLYTVFAVYVWRERPRDEREELQTLTSSKVAYLVGAGALTVGIVVQLIQHDIDLWLPISLGLMVLSKAVALYFIGRREE